MSTDVSTFSAAAPTAGAPRRRARQRSLVGAEILRLRRRRGLMITVLLLTVGILFVVGTILEILHSVSPKDHGPPGGASSWMGMTIVLTQLGAISGILIGAAAGSLDLSAGVMRATVVTGRSRFQLYAARIPAVLALIVPLIAVTYAAVCGYSALFAGHNYVPKASTMIHGGLWAMLVICTFSLIALGFSALVGSRSATVGVMLAIDLVAGPLLATPNWRSFIGLRESFFAVTLNWVTPERLSAHNGIPSPSEAGWRAGLVIVVWIVGMLAIGAWRTERRDL